MNSKYLHLGGDNSYYYEGSSSYWHDISAPNSAKDGGAIYNALNAALNINNSTSNTYVDIVNNTATEKGGGIYNAGDMTISSTYLALGGFNTTNKANKAGIKHDVDAKPRKNNRKPDEIKRELIQGLYKYIVVYKKVGIAIN